jgi:hypothetical protein
MEDTCVYKMVNENGVIFQVLYANDILLIENNIHLL